MKNDQERPHGHEVNQYPWQREVEYSIATFGKSILQTRDYTVRYGEFHCDARQELIAELTIAILEAGKVSGNRVQGDPFSREGKLSRHVIEICKHRVWKLARKANETIEWPSDPAEARELEDELDAEVDVEAAADEHSENEEPVNEEPPLESQEPNEGPDHDVRDDARRTVRIAFVPINERNMQTLPDPNQRGEHGFSEVETGIETDKVLAFMHYLSEDEQRVLGVRYLNGGTEITTFSEIARQIGIHERQVRRIHERALAKLREWMTENIPEEVSS